MSNHDEKKIDIIDCKEIGTERNLYFNGKVLTARDFQLEQEFYLGRDHLHHRLFHGWGVVCGLEVEHHRDERCQDDWVIVQPGIAVDCCGRTIILKEERAFQLPSIYHHEDTEQASAQENAGDVQAEAHHPPEHHHHLKLPVLVGIHYAEEPRELVPALLCNPDQEENSRLEETAELEALDLWDVHLDCWCDPKVFYDLLKDQPEGKHEEKCEQPETKPPHFGCLEPDCHCGQFVPLALITSRSGNNHIPFAIDMFGRRTLPPPPTCLTHIVGVNWSHGGEVKLSELENKMGSALMIYFDRPLKNVAAPDNRRSGINRYTFVVQYAGAQRSQEFLGIERDREPCLGPDDCTAIFPIDKDHLDENRREYIANYWVYVALKCDFILDCNGIAVDANHIDGRVPRYGDHGAGRWRSGNGTPGGVFESWFRVVADK